MRGGRPAPRDDLAGEGTLLLAEPGKRYVAYLPQTPKGGPASFQLARGTYRARWYNPRTGEWHDLAAVSQAADGMWTSPQAADAGDWAMLLELD
jgi:hypothetical protein